MRKHRRVKSALPSHRLLTDRIFEELKQRILFFRIRPGERLIEDDLAREWHTSRTPVREACKRLAEAGLIRAVPHRGYYIRDVHLPEIEELYEVRVALETAAVEAAVRRKGTNWAPLRATWSHAPNPLPPAETALRLDEAFHVAIAQATGNHTLVEYLRAINEQIRAIRAKDFAQPERIRTTYRQHRRILQLIAGGDGPAAARAVRDHILESRTHAINAVKELLAAAYSR